MGGLYRPRPAFSLRFRWVQEATPGPAWKRLFERTWKSYSAWFAKEGERKRPSLAASREALDRHMPELVPTWERLSALAGGYELPARMLSLYRPTPYLTGCSQAVWQKGEPVLVRNYDYHPAAFESLFLHSSWTGTQTLASSDCLWGALDGINEHGLVVSLSFGGRREVGDGFGIPLILRYILETARTAAEGVSVLQRVPSHMSYNVSLLDAAGERAVVAVAPDRSSLVERKNVATNHQADSDWKEYERFTHSGDRERYLNNLLSTDSLTIEDFLERFLRLPLFHQRYDRAFGTLYTAAYFPLSRRAKYLWQGQQVEQALFDFRPQDLVLQFGTGQ